MFVLLLLTMLAIALPVTVHAQDSANREERFFDWASLTFPAAEYANRRNAMTAALEQNGGGVLLVPSNFPVGGPTFRQLDDFLYFTGLELPSSILVMNADAGETILFAPRRDAQFERPSRKNDFPGRPLADNYGLLIQGVVGGGGALAGGLPQEGIFRTREKNRVEECAGTNAGRSHQLLPGTPKGRHRFRQATLACRRTGRDSRVWCRE